MAPTPRGLKLAGQLGGTGKDADKGKQRTEFENQRRKGNIGKDRPPAYKPQDDGQRGGYVNRTGKSMAPGGGGRFAAFVSKLESQGKDAGSAKAIAASVGRAKYGKAKFQQMAAKGRK